MLFDKPGIVQKAAGRRTSADKKINENAAQNERRLLKERKTQKVNSGSTYPRT